MFVSARTLNASEVKSCWLCAQWPLYGSSELKRRPNKLSRSAGLHLQQSSFDIRWPSRSSTQVQVSRLYFTRVKILVNELAIQICAAIRVSPVTLTPINSSIDKIRHAPSRYLIWSKACLSHRYMTLMAYANSLSRRLLKADDSWKSTT